MQALVFKIFRDEITRFCHKFVSLNVTVTLR